MKKRQRKKSQKKLLELMKTANSFADYQKYYLEMIMSCKRIIINPAGVTRRKQFLSK